MPTFPPQLKIVRRMADGSIPEGAVVAQAPPNEVNVEFIIRNEKFNAVFSTAIEPFDLKSLSQSTNRVLFDMPTVIPTSRAALLPRASIELPVRITLLFTAATTPLSDRQDATVTSATPRTVTLEARA